MNGDVQHQAADATRRLAVAASELQALIVGTVERDDIGLLRWMGEVKHAVATLETNLFERCRVCGQPDCAHNNCSHTDNVRPIR